MKKVVDVSLPIGPVHPCFKEPARIKCEARPESCGRSARVSTSTPMPPIQWVKLRQKSTPRGSVSTCGRMDAPVVVNPLTVSKNAST